MIFGVDDSSSSHSNNRENIFFSVRSRPIDDMNGKVDGAEQKFSIDFTKPKTKFCLILRYNGDNSYLFLDGKKSVSLKLIIGISKQFSKENISEKFDVTESEEVSLKRNVYV